LIESLLEPSRQIVEGYRSTTFALRNGRVIVGVIRERGEKAFSVVDANNKQYTIPADQIETQQDSSVSLMPEGLPQNWNREEFTDLVAYLETLRSGDNTKHGAGIRGGIHLPPGFSIQTVATGLSGAVALETTSDGRVFVCEQQGRLRVIENDRLQETPFATFPVDADWERGLIGVTVHPDFPRTPYVYVCYVAKEPYPHHRLSRLTARGNTAEPESELILLRGDDQRKLGGKVPAGHQGGAVHFGTDGKLYLGLGEQTAETPSQSLDSFQGKILRINPDGSIPSDNPFVREAQGKYRAVWARGLRNPFTFAIHPQTGLMLINDVGGKFEEINVGQAGGNYGWPLVDHGPHEGDEFLDPIHWYHQASIAGGDFVPDSSAWPPEYKGHYLFADFVHGEIRSIDPEDPRHSQTIVSALRRPVDLRFAADGSLYVLLRNAWVIDGKFEGGTSSLMKIVPPESQ
jgi:glucose/arabinose dehydrogenase